MTGNREHIIIIRIYIYVVYILEYSVYVYHSGRVSFRTPQRVSQLGGNEEKYQP